MFYKLIIASILIGISIVSGYQLNLIMDYIDLEQADDRPELLELFNEGYTEVCLDDYYFGKKLTSCIMNPDYYIFEETEISYNIHNTNDLENFDKGGTHCAYYVTVVTTEDNDITFGCPFSWGNDWNKTQYKMEFLKVDGFENDFLHIQTKYVESKFRPFGIENRNPDTMRFK